MAADPTDSPARTADRVARYKALLAPGSGLREGLERIQHGRTGALVVLGYNRDVAGLFTGGFGIDVPFAPTSLRELAKMDGAILLSSDLSRILYAGVHLAASPEIPTVETGTRHGAADRFARQTGVPVVTVSASMSTIALFLEGERHPILPPGELMNRANQLLKTLGQYADRLRQLLATLTTAELHDQVTDRDVASVLQRWEMSRRLHVETSAAVRELGTDGRLLGLQLQELWPDLSGQIELLALDYTTVEGDPLDVTALAALSTHDVLNLDLVLRELRLAPDDMGGHGHRVLAQIPGLPSTVGPRLVAHFGTVQNLVAAPQHELQGIEGVGEQRAKAIREALLRLEEPGG
ncbi:DNA integrity scanning diadenylate cyclase DisA [Parenemella sanctibonifatiensis]|uniref:DNA integrity scanning protein DisA n=1 Tax=Parenemella sanctibonifatiensis TaxID=2016505 RepID=A0A255E5I8_9ACTN|nr:DNA integrity scanning diadenylate cyclase DisA [Parenemella sanctibonifatiensis]OYN84652.1 DNA integrity scanning protein DisA [Parenemella sanctibonifatiensis]OYN92580.1 DNA integrity scanning protein DisA [Parenemella sanctibonifatiensis]